jgi:Ca-activated chloride channel family protein
LQPRCAEVVVKAAIVLAAALLIAPAAVSAQTLEQVPQLPKETAVQQQAPPAQTAAAETGRPTFRSSAALVALNVTVQDGGAKFISGLQPADFAIYEDGVKQDVRFFESASVPVDLIVLIDASSSMGDKMDLVHDAATGFLRTLRSSDRGAVVAFADSVNVIQPLTSNHEVLEKAVKSTTAHGATSLYNALYISLKQFGQMARASGDVRRQAIVVLSDGEDTSSLVTFDDVLGLARKMGVNIYTVSLQSRWAAQREAEQGGRHYFNDADYSMKMLARETGAQAFFAGPTELRGVYSKIATELANQYSIGYVPANARPDGRFRRIVVQIITRPELHPRTRQGYTAEGLR